MDDLIQMDAEMISSLLEKSGARVMARAGRSEHYSAPREFSFEVKAIFPNSLGLHIVARQYNYALPWETSGRGGIDRVDVFLTRNSSYSELPKGEPFFQGDYVEEGIIYEQLEKIIERVSNVNSKLFTLQQLTGDLPQE